MNADDVFFFFSSRRRHTRYWRDWSSDVCSSRFRVYKLSLDKTQEVLFSFLDESFQAFGGVPEELLTDNMKTVMDLPRTNYSKGKVNNKFQQFAKIGRASCRERV